MTYHAAVTWVRARRVGVLGFGVLFAVLLSAFTLAGGFFGFDFAGEREPYPELIDFEERPFVCLEGAQPCPSDPNEICCIPPPDTYFWLGTGERSPPLPEPEEWCHPTMVYPCGENLEDECCAPDLYGYSERAAWVDQRA